MNIDGTIFAIDFDGTCVTHEFPDVGDDIGAQKVLKRIIKEGGKLILWTMRGTQNDALGDAIKWFAYNDIMLYGIQINPTQRQWTDSFKALAHVYIDDAALGCPLKFGTGDNKDARPFVDWPHVELKIFGNNE